jgi:LysM repeat protein
MKQMITLICMGLFAAPLFGHPVMPGDSIGKKIVDGKAYVMLKVTKGDNLGAIARQYSASVENIRQINKLPSENINIGQVILVPARGKSTGTSLAAAPTVVDKPAPMAAPATSVSATKSGGDPQKHTVKAGESLFAVARANNVSVEQIKRWNNLSTDGLRVGQVLLVSEPTTASQPKPSVAGSPETAGTEGTTIKEKPGVHVVKPGETLYGIARQYGMDARDLKVLNKIEDPNLQVGQSLRVRQDPPANSNQGTPLIDMIEKTTAADSSSGTGFTDLKVLTAAPGTMVAPEAKVSTYKDKATGKSYQRVEEEGTVGVIDDYVTDQTKFYAFHRYLPVGSYIRIDYPEKGQSILAEVTNQLPGRDPHVVRLSAKCLDYLMIRQPGAAVRIRYVIPSAK